MKTKTLLKKLEEHGRIDEKGKSGGPAWYEKQAKGAKKAKSATVKCPKCGTMVNVD